MGNVKGQNNLKEMVDILKGRFGTWMEPIEMESKGMEPVGVGTCRGGT